MLIDKYNYIRALHERFCEFSGDMAMTEQAEWKKAHKQLHATLGKNQRRLLLAMVDAHGLLLDRISLESFALGFRLALGICTELVPYSFDADMEQRAMRRMTDEECP